MISASQILSTSAIALFFLIVSIGPGESSVRPSRDLTSKKIKYQTAFGRCPSRSAGTLALKLIETFDKSRSLKDIKGRLLEERLIENHFISEYKVDFDPLKNLLRFSFECPEPLMKVQIYKENGLDSYEAILVDNGKLYDPTYEVLLRTEKKISKTLPYLAIPVGEMDQNTQMSISKLVKKMDVKLRNKLSELILDEKGELTVILSVRGNPSSVFLGNSEWTEKVSKLHRIVRYMELNKKIPAIINLTNSKKVVVKFNGKF